jgi:predicted  nucleic acid-binding Zn-ribbon protein
MSEKDAYVEKLKARLDEWSAALDNLEAKARKAGADAKSGSEDQIKALRQQRDSAKAKLAEVQSASGDAWEDLQKGLDSMLDALQEGLEKATSRFQ